MNRPTVTRTLLTMVVPGLLLAPMVLAYAAPEAVLPDSVKAAEAPTKTEAARMVEEYATVRVNQAGRVMEVQFTAGKERMRDNKSTNLVQVLTRLGKDGWRVRTATTGEAVGLDEALLKAGNGQVTEYLLARETAYTPPEDTGDEPDTGAPKKDTGSK